MLTPDQIDVLYDNLNRITNDLNNYIIDDICRRIAKSGSFTKTTLYQQYKLKTLGVDFKAIEKEIARRLNISLRDVRKIFKDVAKTTHGSDAKRLTDKPIPFKDNIQLQKIVHAATSLAESDFSNITQTIGMVSPTGENLPLKAFYRATMDWTFNNVYNGTVDYNAAIRQACFTLADRGLTTVEYESGVTTSLEAAVRRNMLGGLGLMVEEISNYNHDELGANGWEISAHAMSAPDHEPIQGKQYTDKEYEELNNSLKRRIGTLNCRHFAFPIILGVNSPQYSDKQLKDFKENNAKGVIIEGKHYTKYKASQEQRRLERVIRKWKKRLRAAESAEDKKLTEYTRAHLNNARRAYKEFSDAAGLKTQEDRLFVAA